MGNSFSRTISVEEADPIVVSLGASAEVILGGAQHIHGYVAHHFAPERELNLQLTARARQFSTFLMVIGKILPGGGALDPEHAIVIQNKDELIIPLLLDKLPSAKAFQKAISSMSPEQQRFSKAYRSMQLSGTVF